MPADYLRRLGEAWWYVCRRFMRDRRLCRPYTWFLAPYFFEQMSYALAIHREGIPWSVLPSIYNFIPSAYAPDEDLGLLAGDSVVMVHAVSPVRSWLHKERDVECHPVLLPLFRRVREIAAAA